MASSKVISMLIGCAMLSTSVVASSVENRQFSYGDVFKMQYATDPIYHQSQDLIVYVRHHMDKQTDKNVKTLWKISSDGKINQPLISEHGSSYGAAFSPDGKKIAFIADFSGASEIYIQDLANGKLTLLETKYTGSSKLSWSTDSKQLAFSQFVKTKPSVFAAKAQKPQGAAWAKDATFIDKETYRADGSGYLPNGFRQIFIANLANHKVEQMTFAAYDHKSTLSWSADNTKLYFSANRQGKNELQPADTNVFWLEPNTGKVQQLTHAFGHENNPRVSPNGKWLAYTGFKQEYKGYHVADIYLTTLDGSETKVLTKQFDRSAKNIAWGSDSESLFFQYDDNGNTFIAKTDFNGNMQTLTDKVGGTAFGRPYSGGSFSVNGSDKIAFTYGPVEDMANIAIVDGTASATQTTDINVQQITQLNKQLFADIDLASVEEINYPSSVDGANIQGWVVKPANFDASKKYPLILEIHGGPFTNYGARFAAEAQLLASAGYVVLYTNPRGSTSYGQAFADLIHHKFPADGYHDLLAGVDHVVAQGYIDQEKLFVTGGSAGGTLASWLIGKTDRFAASVVVKPVINWTSQVMYSDIGEYIAKHWFGKTPWQAPLEYWHRSPLSLVPNVKTPTMLLTGEVDYRTPMAETEQYYQALKINGVETAMVRIPGASHGITSRPSNLITKTEHVIKWFDRFAKPNSN